jgi:hypothetical protein
MGQAHEADAHCSAIVFLQSAFRPISGEAPVVVYRPNEIPPWHQLSRSRMIAFLTDFLISIVPTFLVSRLLLWVTKRWSDSALRLIAVHCVALGLCVLVGSWVLVGDGAGPVIAALVLFAPGQLAWFLIDIFRLVFRGRQEGK